MPGPPDKWTDSLDLSQYANTAAVLQGLSDAWTAYYTAHGVYPTVWAVVGTKMLYGGY